MKLHWPLLQTLVLRELQARYRGSLLGGLWAFVTPLMMLAVYTAVFGEIFRMRWAAPDVSSGVVSRADFALQLYCGLLVFNFFGEAVSRAPGTILGHANYVKKVVFPLDLLPVASALASFVHTLGGLAVLLAMRAWVHEGIPATALLFPVVLVPVLLYALGLCWFLAALGVYVRDTGQAVGLILAALMFLSPVFYPSSLVPTDWQGLFALNPLTLPIDLGRELLLAGRLPDGVANAVFAGWIGGLAVALAGLWFFRKTRDGFADVL